MTGSTYKMPADITQVGDTMYIDVQAKDIKKMYFEVWRQETSNMILSKETVRHHVSFFATYGFMLFFILIVISAVNTYWNKAYKRVKDIYAKTETSRATSEKMGKLTVARYGILDRLFFYLLLWISVGSLDFLLMSSCFYHFPYLAIMLFSFIVTNVIRRAVSATKLKGYDDTEIADNIDGAIKDLVNKTLGEHLREFIIKVLNGNKETEK